MRSTKTVITPTASVVPVMLVLGLSVKWLFLVVLPVVIVAILLMEKLAPAALAAIPRPGDVFLVIFLVAPLTLGLISARTLWRQG